jgi:hypothetical protein
MKNEPDIDESRKELSVIVTIVVVGKNSANP